MQNETIAYIGIGSNLHNPIAQVRQTILRLGELPESKILKTSGLYTTSPVGVDGHPDYVNAVVSISTQLTSSKLLHALLNLEKIAGREREPGVVSPRVIDHDLLLYGNQVINDPELTVPHPRMHNRGFVLIPLYEIAPELVFPDGKVLKLQVQEWKDKYTDIVSRITDE